MTNIAHVTELQAVNNMLLSIGETKVNSLATGLTEASLAYEKLQQVNMQVQMSGWHCNTWKNYKLYKNADDMFPVGNDVLTIDTVGASAHLDVAVHKSSDGTRFILWDNRNHTELWESGPDYIEVTIVYLMNFVDLPPTLQTFIMMKAGHEYQKGMISSPLLFEFTAESVAEAMMLAEADDAETADTNCLMSSPTLYAGTYRNNMLWGR